MDYVQISANNEYFATGVKTQVLKNSKHHS
jgi:hypothetical protein